MTMEIATNLWCAQLVVVHAQRALGRGGHEPARVQGGREVRRGGRDFSALESLPEVRGGS